MKALIQLLVVLAGTSYASERSPNDARQVRSSLGTNAKSEIDTVRTRRISIIISAQTKASEIPEWLETLNDEGLWPDAVDYTTGCDARRANWPAQTHWERILILSSAWRGGMPGADQAYVKNPQLRRDIERAMGFWFRNDFTKPGCLDGGGTPACPCGTAGFWNTNWFSNIILIPRYVSQTCLVLDGTLSEYDRGFCDIVVSRSYETFKRYVNGLGYLTGANALEVARNGIDLAVRSPGDTALLTDAYSRVHSEMVIVDAIKADGIRRDGSFGQHAGMIYNGNYGREFLNAILALELASIGTSYSANNDARAAYDVLLDGDQWMIFLNILNGGVLKFDYSVVGRFIVFPVIDNQPSASIQINVSAVHDLGRQWGSQKLLEVSERLEKPSNNANVGDLRGNRLFYSNDYMVHRGNGYVTTLKLWSSRTVNTECVNTANPLGFHLADGVLRNYMVGNEYDDIGASMDWNLIPGITVDYGATPLSCAKTGWTGIESFSGGVSTGAAGISAMRYTNPSTKSLKWQKAWFFLDNDIQRVMVAGIVSTTSAPVYSVLDQRLQTGSVVFDGGSSSPGNTTSVWHGGVGYTFDQKKSNVKLEYKTGVVTGSWQAIGTSPSPPTSIPLFSAWFTHKNLATPLEYTVYPGTPNAQAFNQKARASQVTTLKNDVHVSAVFDDISSTAMVVFWDAAGGSASFTSKEGTSMTITSSKAIALVYRVAAGTVTISDPSQTLSSVDVTLKLVSGKKPASSWGSAATKQLKFTLPRGGLAGSSVTLPV